MADGIKDKVAVIGMGCTRFGERWDCGPEDLMIEAYEECIQDAGIDKDDIQMAWFGNCFDEVGVGKSAIPMPTALKMPYTPVTRVENFCASGTESFRGAVYAVASGACDIAIAMGVEKLKDTGYGGLPDFGQAMGTKMRLMSPNLTAPGGFAMMATRYFDHYDLSPEEGKKVLAMISAKSHKNGAKNPKAHLRREVSVEQVMGAPIIAWPLGLFDCCGVSDGASCAIVARPEIAKELGKTDPVMVKALQIAVTSGEESLTQDWDGTHLETTTRAAQKAYDEAGIKNAREEVNMMELHDCFSITELVTYEDLQISPRGGGPKDVQDGFFDLDGKVPSQPDGGLKCFGHPIGASGLRMIYEMYLQFLGRAGDRQLKDPKIGLTHNLGGFPAMSVCSVAIVGR